MQDFDGVAVEDGNNGAGEAGCCIIGERKPYRGEALLVFGGSFPWIAYKHRLLRLLSKELLLDIVLHQTKR